MSAAPLVGAQLLAVLLAYRDRGLSVRGTANALGLTTGRVSGVLWRHDRRSGRAYSAQAPHWAREQQRLRADRVVELSAAGLSTAEIAGRVGITARSVGRILQRRRTVGTCVSPPGQSAAAERRAGESAYQGATAAAAVLRAESVPPPEIVLGPDGAGDTAGLCAWVDGEPHRWWRCSLAAVRGAYCEAHAAVCYPAAALRSVPSQPVRRPYGGCPNNVARQERPELVSRPRPPMEQNPPAVSDVGDLGVWICLTVG